MKVIPGHGAWLSYSDTECDGFLQTIQQFASSSKWNKQLPHPLIAPNSFNSIKQAALLSSGSSSISNTNPRVSMASVIAGCIMSHRWMVLSFSSILLATSFCLCRVSSQGYHFSNHRYCEIAEILIIPDARNTLCSPVELKTTLSCFLLAAPCILVVVESRYRHSGSQECQKYPNKDITSPSYWI